MPGRTLILLSCSRSKRPGGVSFDAAARRFASSGALPGPSSGFIGTRKEIFDLLHGGRQLHNEDQQGGFRGDVAANKALLLGPDFGGRAPGEPVYMPAYRRYNGRFFAALDALAPTFWSGLHKHPIEILFVSGLYGLMYWDEAIQEYDCHLSDYRVPDRTQITALWKPVLTPALRDFLSAQARADHPIQYIYDLLSEETYQKAFDWEEVSKQVASLHHRIFQGVAGLDILPWLATILGTHLDRFEESRERFRDGEWLECCTDDKLKILFGFESKLNADTLATREGDLNHVRQAVLRAHPSLEWLPRQVFEDLVLAEHSRLKVERLPRFDFGAVIVSFTKVVERYFKTVLPGCPPQPQFGEIIAAIKLRRGWMALRWELQELSKLRGEGGAHPGNRNVNDLLRARGLAFNILVSGEKIREVESPKQKPLE
jgi:hypothetical protein